MGAATKLVRHAVPHLLEATVGPTACFLTGRALWGMDGALLLALIWTGACLARRVVQGRRLSGLLLIGMITLLLRTSVSLALHSEQAYLIAPALVTAVMGLVFVASAAMGKPLLGRVIGDLVPARWVDTDDPRTARLCRIGSTIWGAEQILTAGISLALILRVSTSTYLVFHEFVSWGVFAAVAVLAAPLLWPRIRELRVGPLTKCCVHDTLSAGLAPDDVFHGHCDSTSGGEPKGACRAARRPNPAPASFFPSSSCASI